MPKKAETKTEEKAPKKLTQKGFEKKVIELSEKGLTSEKIGENLRKQGIHPNEFKGKISKILKDAGKYTNSDLKNVEEKLERLKAHFKDNKQDKRAMREKDKIFSRLRKLKKYNKIPLK